MLCLGPGLPTSDGPAALDYATLACGRPLFEEVEEPSNSVDVEYSPWIA